MFFVIPVSIVLRDQIFFPLSLIVPYFSLYFVNLCELNFCHCIGGDFLRSRCKLHFLRDWIFFFCSSTRQQIWHETTLNLFLSVMFFQAPRNVNVGNKSKWESACSYKVLGEILFYFPSATSFVKIIFLTAPQLETGEGTVVSGIPFYWLCGLSESQLCI